LKVVYSEKSKKQDGLTDLSQTVCLWEINCPDKKVSLLSTSHYSKEGEMTIHQLWLSLEWKSIAPETLMDHLYKEF
jgi:hypothetical protein